MDYKKVAGKRIKAAREAEGLTQAGLASKIPGLTPSRLGNFEQGTRYPSAELLVAMAKILKEPASYLGGLDDDLTLQSLARKYVRMDSRGKNTLHRVAESQPPKYGATTEEEEDVG